MSRFTKLFEPISIGAIHLENRIAMAPMGTCLSHEDGSVSERTQSFWEERARGGAGLIIVEGACVDYQRARIVTREISIDDDNYIPGLSMLAESIKRHGSKAAIQLIHGGRSSGWPALGREPASIPVAGGPEPVGPSPIPAPGFEAPRELDIDEIPQIVNAFAKAAERAKKAEFDAVEIHAGHNYIIGNFLSAASNKRTDAYGGSVENRARLLLEVMTAVRESVGRDYPVWCRLNAEEYGIADGVTLEESRKFAQMLEEAGADAVHVTVMGYLKDVLKGPIVHYPGNLIHLAEGIKRVVSVPVMTFGRISPELGEKVLGEGKADIITMARPLIADPELPNKLKSGRASDIRPCIYCNVCIDEVANHHREVCCAVNPCAGRENECKVETSGQPKRVLVVGAGPSGIMAATTAAQRGHGVILYDRAPRLGGTLNLVGVLKEEVESLVNYLTTQVKNSGVQVLLRKEMHPEQIEALKPDVAVLATGPKILPPQIPGSSKNNVINGTDIRRMLVGDINPASLRNVAGKRILWYLGPIPFGRLFSPSLIRRLSRLWMPFGKRIVIIGGNRPGCEIAEFLAQRGKQVTIVEGGNKLAKDEVDILRASLLSRLRDLGVIMLRYVEYKEIVEQGLIIVTSDGEQSIIEADTMILATDPQPDTVIPKLLEGKSVEVYPIGDCAEPGGIRQAVSSGFQTGLRI
ncbi:FAD-dependent oxidoreductase [Chloroflexota bacterium]